MNDTQLSYSSRELTTIWNSYGFESKLFSLISALGRHGTSPSILVDEPFLKAIMELARRRAQQSLKERASIVVPAGYNLVGVPDLDQFLQPDEIYVAIRNDEGDVEYLKGFVAITRNPAMDPGDLRLLYAVGELPSSSTLRMAELTNCIVFSTQGDGRSITSTMGGGDLDGDRYDVSCLSLRRATPLTTAAPSQIITHPELIPQAEVQPLTYVSVRPPDLAQDCSIKDVAAHFVEMIVQVRRE